MDRLSEGAKTSGWDKINKQLRDRERNRVHCELVQWKNKCERNPNRVNVIFRSNRKIVNFWSMHRKTAEFDINICDTHVPHWRKQCEWKNGNVFSRFVSHLFLFRDRLLFLLLCYFFCCNSQTKFSILPFGRGKHLLAIFLSVSVAERFYCIKINQKVHYDFPRTHIAFGEQCQGKMTCSA